MRGGLGGKIESPDREADGWPATFPFSDVIKIKGARNGGTCPNECLRDGRRNLRLDLVKTAPPRCETTPGFKLHVAYPTAEGFAVAEIWETKEQHEKFFNEHVKPNVPDDVNPDVVELHTLVTP